ncbi:low molecular weight protein-tyrosine-phosphatase [Dyella sp.]|uniref:low molecular weight protein-tyrosine-phosphatase n=1 Tax=Dyella sp. TaxID=1869338 RepID=UPI002FDB2AAC
MFKNILVICVGNICRSPAAEFLFRDKLRHRGIQVRSAGLKAMVGYPMDDNAMRVLKAHGIDAAEHRARQLNADMLREADLVLAMEREHLGAAARLAPEASGKLFLLDKWREAGDIPDPYRRSQQVFEHVHAMIERGVDSWLKYL